MSDEIELTAEEVAAAEHEAYVALMRGQLADLEAQCLEHVDNPARLAVKERRAGEVRVRLEELAPKRTAARGQSRLRGEGAEKRGAE